MRCFWWPQLWFLLLISSGYIGAGMLSAAVAGGVFASPPPGSILAAILSLHNAGNVSFSFPCVCVSVRVGSAYIITDLICLIKPVLAQCSVVQLFLKKVLTVDLIWSLTFYIWSFCQNGSLISPCDSAALLPSLTLHLIKIWWPLPFSEEKICVHGDCIIFVSSHRGSNTFTHLVWSNLSAMDRLRLSSVSLTVCK